MVHPALATLAVSGIAATSLFGVGVVASSGPSAASAPVATTAEVTRIVDGDTIDTSAGRVRLIGIDTPEKGACGYDDATANLAGHLSPGSTVQLWAVPGRDDRDGYGRLLRYVANDKGMDTGLAQITSGLAVARYDSRDGWDAHPKEKQYRVTDELTPAGACEVSAALERERAAAQAEQARQAAEAEAAARAAAEAEAAAQAAAEAAARAAEQAAADAAAEAARVEAQRQAAAAQPKRTAPKPAPAPSEPSSTNSGSTWAPPAGWQTDATMPGYTGCRQGYPGGKINGIYVWKPIPCS